MKVLLIGNYSPDAQTSMAIFARLIQRELEYRGHKVRLIRPKRIVNRFYALPPNLSKWLGYIDKMFLFGLSIKTHARWADVVHICDHSNAYYTRYLQNVPHLVTCHDVLAIQSALGEIPENPTGLSGQILQKIIVRGLQKAQQVVCDSQETKEQAMRVCHLDEKRLILAHCALNYAYSPLSYEESEPQIIDLLRRSNQNIEAIWTQHGSSSAILSFLLHVGGNQWYKNRMGVLEIYSHLRSIKYVPPLIMVGSPFTLEMRQYIEEHDLTQAVIEIVGCSNEELRSLYSIAICLIFPSLAEGFGWPVIEAQACGCPVFTSDRAPMTEIGGQAAIYFDPAQPEQAARIVAQHLDSTESIVEAGLENIKRFTPEAMMDSYLQAYKHVLEGASQRKR